MEFKCDDITLTGPEGQVTVAGDDESDSVDESLFMLRLNMLASDKATVYLDAGVVDDDEAESTPFIVGGGAHLVAYEKEKIRLNVVAMAHYVPSFDIEEEDFDPDLGRIEGTGEVDYYEVGAGMIVSGNLALNADTRFVPYGGILFSSRHGGCGIELPGLRHYRKDQRGH